MNKETIDFYDKESSVYSEKRYPKITQSFTQYLFKTRRDIFLSQLGTIITETDHKSSVLEIGCADGVLFRQMEVRFASQLGRLVGMDVSPKMVEEARSKNNNTGATFFVRDELPEGTFDIVIELGVHPFDLEAELAYVKSRLNLGGYFLYSVVGSDSLYVRMKMKKEPFIKDYLSYNAYESEFLKLFSIVNSKGYGVFVPKLWSVPVVARPLQPIVDWIFRLIAPTLFHEKIYTLRSKVK